MIVEISRNKYIQKKPNEKKLELMEAFLTSNPEIWFSRRDLEIIFDYTGIRRIINELRNKGLPIISDTRKGYKLTNNKKEIKKCYEELRNRALRQLTACRAMKRNL